MLLLRPNPCFLPSLLVFAACCCLTPLARAQSTPAPDTAPLTAKDGAALFSKSGCTFCHGPQGNGTERAPSIHEVRKRKTDDEIFHQIHDGGQMMPPFGDALTEAEIRAIVAFLRAKDGWELLPKQPSS